MKLCFFLLLFYFFDSGENLKWPFVEKLEALQIKEFKERLDRFMLLACRMAWVKKPVPFAKPGIMIFTLLCVSP